MTVKKYHPIWPLWALLCSLVGLGWCGYVAFPSQASAPCLTTGCALFRTVELMGISLWWIGGAYFFVLSLLCLRGYYAFAAKLASLALFIDTLFLVVMLFSAPCADCLVVALFFGLSYLCLRPAPDVWFAGMEARRWLFPVWLALFVCNTSLAAYEAVPPWTLGGDTTASVRIYFSPSCPHCREAVAYFGATACLYPVLEKKGDFVAVRKLAALLQQMPVDEAFWRSLHGQEAPPPISPVHSWWLYLQAARNKAAIFRQGYTALPVIQVQGMPAQWSKTLHVAPEQENVGTPPVVTEPLPWEESFGACGQEQEAPCP